MEKKPSTDRSRASKSPRVAHGGTRTKSVRKVLCAHPRTRACAAAPLIFSCSHCLRSFTSLGSSALACGRGKLFFSSPEMDATPDEAASRAAVRAKAALAKAASIISEDAGRFLRPRGFLCDFFQCRGS